MEGAMGIIQQQAEEAIQRLGAQTIVTAEQVADSVLRQAAYWEIPLPPTERLLFVRVYSPVVHRDEVFLGNILFNAFLSKAFARGITRGSLGQVEPLANDLESYYFLVRAGTDEAELTDALRAEVNLSLPDLFFGEQDESRGVLGNLARMFTFRKSDFEPFPVYAVPQFLASELERAVRRELNRLLSPDTFRRGVRTALATVAFFYGRTSGGSGDAQSLPNFIEHLVNDKDYDGLLKPGDVRMAFNISSADKPAIKQSIDQETYSTERLRDLLSGLTQQFQASIDNGSTKWLMGFVHKDRKFVELSPAEYLNTILAGCQVGYHLFGRPTAGKAVSCRLCNTARGAVQERYVTTGLKSYRFDNQSHRGQAEKACVKCALHSYLAQKLLGTEMASAGGKLPQVPKTHNLIIHYGKHDDAEVEELVRRIDLVWALVRQHRDAEQVRREVARQVNDLRGRRDREQDTKKKQLFEEQLAKKQTEFEQAQAAVAEVEDDILTVCPWLRESGASPAPPENCSLDALANVQLSESKVERHVLGLGMGGYRMILFLLPQIRAPRDSKEHDFAQRRFSESRVTVTAVLSFLRQLCGCDGPFYYQSLPMLAPEAFRRDTFYIRNEAMSARQAENEYEVVTQLAWKLIWQRGSGGFVRKVVLAERLLQDPLGTFSAVMRDSPILGRKDGSFKRLSGGYRPDWREQDLTEYAKFIRRLSRLRG